MSDDIEAQECKGHNEFLDVLISHNHKIELINNLEKFNVADGIKSLEDFVHKLVNSKNKNDSLIKLKKLIEKKDEKLILEFFDYCAKLCIEDEKFELMCEVTILLQDFINILYKRPVSRLIKQLTYVKVPSKWCERNEFLSENENLHGYNVHNLRPSIIDSYPIGSGVLDILFPRNISPFARLIITYPDEIFQPNNASSGIIESPLFHAIIKFKWRSFACYRYYIVFSSYLAWFAIFTASIVTGYMSLHIISTIVGTIALLFMIRHFIIMYLNGGIPFFLTSKTAIYFAISILPTITALMNIFEVNRLLVFFRPFTIFFLWIGAIGLLVAFKGIGIIFIVIAHICRKVLWLLVFLVLIIVAASHATVIYSNMILNYDKTSLTDENRTKFQDLTQYYNTFNAFWSALLGDYGSWPSDDTLSSLARIAYSLFMAIVILNLVIALVNNVYSEVLNRVYTEWSLLRAQFITTIELNLMTPHERQNKDNFPLTIYYEVFTEEVERWHKKLEEDNISVSRNKIQLLNEMADKMKDEITKMEDDDVTKTTMMDKLNELKQLFPKK
ncbi:hypothetical protein GLOIN_2v1642411 [Rhizophagus clarus]|uniref:Ion transport domain-containing protein n=1 Tax=Rhizophagus clarus TaxID=94130 RepID=A0A8H3QR88_9GLOM|nr:hypothetical protein GLOIN_2v1642411 [Rhizophagus clarus]